MKKRLHYCIIYVQLKKKGAKFFVKLIIFIIFATSMKN